MKTGVYFIFFLTLFNSCKLYYISENDNTLEISIPGEDWEVVYKPEQAVTYNYLRHEGKIYGDDKLFAAAFMDSNITLSLNFYENQNLWHIHNRTNCEESDMQPCKNSILNFSGDLYCCEYSIDSVDVSWPGENHRIVYFKKGAWLVVFHVSMPLSADNKEQIYDEIFSCIRIEKD